MELFLSKYRRMETSPITMELESQRAVEQIFFSSQQTHKISYQLFFQRSRLSLQRCRNTPVCLISDNLHPVHEQKRVSVPYLLNGSDLRFYRYPHAPRSATLCTVPLPCNRPYINCINSFLHYNI
jgi:hypothetical protein